MNVRKVAILVLLSFLIIMFMTLSGCGKMQSTNVISGTVTGDNVDDVVIQMTGSETKSVTTDVSGKYSFNNQDNGYFLITPYRDGYSFTPANASVTVSYVSATNIDFTDKWVGYTISGAVNGDVLANVTMTAYDSGTNTSVLSVVTNEDGKYTLTNTNIINKTFDVTPSLAGYRFKPPTTPVTVKTASVPNINFVANAVHTNGSSKGTYTWDSATGAMKITWTSVTFPCNWPQKSTETDESQVTISTTTMTWPDKVTWPGVMVWTSTNATENDPAGKWTATDQSGNTYTATFADTSIKTDSSTGAVTATGSISMDATIIACAYAWANADAANWSTGDHTVRLSYQDPGNAAANVTVTGTGISDSQTLSHIDADKAWETSVDLGKSPTQPYTYKFTVTDSTGPAGAWEEASCFVEWATSLCTKWDDLHKQLTFNWTPTTDSGSQYIVLLQDSDNQPIWESDTITATSASYYGIRGLLPTTGTKTYYYYVIVKGTSNCSNGTSISAAGSFICTTSACPTTCP